MKSVVDLSQRVEARLSGRQGLLSLPAGGDLVRQFVQVDRRGFKLVPRCLEEGENVTKLLCAVLVEQPREFTLVLQAVADESVFQSVAVDADEVDHMRAGLASYLRLLHAIARDVDVELGRSIVGLGVLANEGLLVHLPQQLVFVPVRQVLLQLHGGGRHAVHDLHDYAQDVRVVGDDVIVRLELIVRTRAA